ncbi:hypothetical protein BKI51_10355 [Alphaproteobacteria bacterium AO1-B]|nr:hypothetical protein BKI51_10355 [Alphaproteobacteria bacterium AO1-B]
MTAVNNRSADHTDPTGNHLLNYKTVWIHGAGLSGSTWDRLAARFEDAAQPDLPGHGRAAPVLPARVETFADTMQGDVPQGAVLIGHSLGGMVALELASRLGSSVKALVLIECVPTVRTGPAARLIASMFAGIFSALPPGWLAKLSALGQTPDTAAELQNQISRMTRAGLRSALEACVHYDGRRHLANIHAPCLILIGRRNKATHQGAKLMASRIAKAKLVELEGGHILHTDAPNALMTAIEDFVRKIEPIETRPS